MKAEASTAEARLLAYMPMVDAEAYRRSTARHDWRDDLRSAGMGALWRVCQSFDDSKGVKFSSYAAFAIRNAIIDEIRKLTLVSRRVVEWKKRRYKAEIDLMQKLMRMPTDDEISAGMKCGAKRRMRADNAFKSGFSIVSLETPISRGDGSSLTVADFVTDDGPIPGEKISERDYAGELAAIMENMSPRDRTVFRLRFFDNINLEEIGKRIGVTESRVHQIIKKNCRLMEQKLRKAA